MKVKNRVFEQILNRLIGDSDIKIFFNCEINTVFYLMFNIKKICKRKQTWNLERNIS